MKRVELAAELREENGKGVARSLRRAGKIPGVLYGGGKSLSLSLDSAELTRILHTGGGENALITLKIPGMKERAADLLTILRDFQLDPVTGKLLHADFFEISLEKPIRVRVHVELVGGTSAGVKEGGMLQHQLREVELECLPMVIPDRLEVDVSALAIGDAVHIRDLRVAEGIKILEAPDQVVVSVAAPISEAKLEEMLTATPVEGKEPEVITREKEEGEEVKAEGKEGAETSASDKKEEIKKKKEETKAKG